MNETFIALVSLVVGLVATIVGGFAYLMGEIRKVATGTAKDIALLRTEINAKVDQNAQRETEARESMRSEVNAAITRIETELRSMSERLVRRTDVEAVEARLTRVSDKLERKLDQLIQVVSLMGSGGVRHRLSQFNEGEGK